MSLGEGATLERIRRQKADFVAADVAVVHIENLQPGVLGSFSSEAANQVIDNIMWRLFEGSNWCCRYCPDPVTLPTTKEDEMPRSEGNSCDCCVEGWGFSLYKGLFVTLLVELRLLEAGTSCSDPWPSVTCLVRPATLRSKSHAVLSETADLGVQNSLVGMVHLRLCKPQSSEIRP